MLESGTPDIESFLAHTISTVVRQDLTSIYTYPVIGLINLARCLLQNKIIYFYNPYNPINFVNDSIVMNLAVI